MRLSHSGITLLELLCVMACLGVLAVMSLPLSLSYRLNLQRQAAVDALRHLLASAQAEAMAQGRHVWVCGSGDGRRCDGSWSTYQLLRWEQGRVRQQLQVAPSVAVTYHGNFGHNQAIEFLGNGMTHGQDGRFDFCTQSRWVPRHCQSLILHFSGQTVG